MKENRYDDPIFFEKYSHMPRSEHGLEAAGEWEALQTLLPDFAHKRMLDLGCGYGWHCIYALEMCIRDRVYAHFPGTRNHVLSRN